MFTNLVNLTPHTINIFSGSILEFKFEPSGTIARVETTQEFMGYITIDSGIDIPLMKTIYGNIIDLPEPVQGTVYIASSLVVERAIKLGRTDVVAPDSFNGVLRYPKDHENEKLRGQIKGVTQLQTF